MGLDTVEFILEVEDEFSIRIPDADAEKIRTVGELTQLIVKLNTKEKSVELSHKKVFEKLKEILVNKFSVEKEAITPDANFVKDLFLD